MKRFFKVLLGIIIVLALVIGGGYLYITSGLNAGSQLVINPVDLTNLADGTYTGHYDAGRWANELNVTIKDQKITSIDMMKDIKFPKPEMTEALFKEVINKQNTDVDVISGGTVSCKAYLKAIEDALKQ